MEEGGTRRQEDERCGGAAPSWCTPSARVNLDKHMISRSCALQWCHHPHHLHSHQPPNSDFHTVFNTAGLSNIHHVVFWISDFHKVQVQGLRLKV